MSSSSVEYQATSMVGAQIIINPWVWYNHIVILIRNVYSKSKWRWDSDRIVQVSLNGQHGWPIRYPANIGCSNFKYTHKEKSNSSIERHQRKNELQKKTEMYFTVTLRKRMIEVRTKSARFNTSQRLSDQARMILKKGWFSDPEILEIGGNACH